jgi:hypothetical protein
MRYLVATLEALLALGFLATVVFQLISGRFGAVNLASDLILAALGLWLARKAIANIRAKPGLGQA